MPTVSEIELRLEALYRAGRHEFPDKAMEVSSTAGRLSEATDQFNGPGRDTVLLEHRRNLI